MAIKFKHGGVAFTADTPEEALRLSTLLKERDAEAAQKRIAEYQKRAGEARFMTKYGDGFQQIIASMDEEMETPWTFEVFLSFIDRLGSPQKAALAALVTHHRMTDEDLRKALSISGNQALAGVLSGISKQAAALGIPARAIFGFENLRNAGKRRSTYTVADKFLQIATDMNWPPAPSKK